MIQGLSREHILILVDGSPLLQNSVAGFDLDQISTNGIKQIEVIKGGASALYGGQAMGGVINIITNRPAELFKYELDLNLEEHSGDIKKNKGYNTAKGFFQGRKDSTAYKLQLSHNQSLVRSWMQNRSLVTLLIYPSSTGTFRLSKRLMTIIKLLLIITTTKKTIKLTVRNYSQMPAIFRLKMPVI